MCLYNLYLNLYLYQPCISKSVSKSIVYNLYLNPYLDYIHIHIYIYVHITYSLLLGFGGPRSEPAPRLRGSQELLEAGLPLATQTIMLKGS